ncbi:MAG: AAA family ATPase [Reyranellaceae bacterium]
MAYQWPMPRLHILGASGCGTTTLGRALCARHGWTQVDTDDVFWLPSDPPYADIRPREERVALMRSLLDAARDWVVSGSMCGWGDVFIPRFDLVVFLTVPTEERIRRLTIRERFGSSRSKTTQPPDNLRLCRDAYALDWGADLLPIFHTSAA